ncbi:MAG: hypothetical protein ACK5L3_15570 [Oscillospiraceae bacterium]
MNRSVFKQSNLWQNIGEVAVQAGSVAQAVLKCAHLLSPARTM